MQASASLKVNKYTVGVEVRNIRGDVRAVELFLAEDLVRDGRLERIQDVLRERRFVPVRSAGHTSMISVAHLVWAKVDLLSAIDELDLNAEGDGDSVLAPVEIELEDGSTVRGALRYVMPSGRRRLTDYLAALPQWVPLRSEEQLYLISREHIVRVSPIEET